jgi:2-hydroxy-3-oxopropionate reductase
MKKIGFIGLGTMGLPIALNLVKAGYQLYVGYHSNRKPAEQIAEKGAVICNTYKEVAENSDVIFTVVPNDKEVETVIFGKDGLYEGLRQGCIVIDMSTIDLTRSREFGVRLKEKGVSFFDAPISGGPGGASAGTLAIMVGGEKSIFDEVKEILDVVGNNIVYCGSNGLGLAAKMANNLIVAAEKAAIAEAVSLAVKAGINPSDLYEVLKNATANSVILNSRMPRFLKDDYSPAFKLSLMYKDLNIITNVGKKLGSPTLVASMVEQIFGMCMEEHKDKDSGAVALFYQDQAGVSFKAK